MEQKNILTTGSDQQVLDENKVDDYLRILTYSFKEFLVWWYIKMPIWHLRMLARISLIVDDNLSFSLLLKNFFLPWHRDFSFIGYFVGITIKAIYIPIALIAYVLVISIYLGIIVLWILLPPATIFFIFRSILNI